MRAAALFTMMFAARAAHADVGAHTDVADVRNVDGELRL
jgi:hypothetical protein